MQIMSDYHRAFSMAKPVPTKPEAIMWKQIRNWWRAWGDLVRVRGFDDRLLADMGLDRETLRDRVMGRERREGAPTDLAASVSTLRPVNRPAPSSRAGAGCPGLDPVPAGRD
jgi:hypothetical protein